MKSREVKIFLKKEGEKMKIISIDKMSKKARRAFYAGQRGSWNGVKPVTRVVKSKKVYDRKREKHLLSQY